MEIRYYFIIIWFHLFIILLSREILKIQEIQVITEQYIEW